MKSAADKLSLPLIIAGPCLVESAEMINVTATHLATLTTTLGFDLIFKASFRKANRLSGKSFSGIGDEKALKILSEAKKRHNLTILTDVHERNEVERVAQFCDVIQIPAFLCRQTDLVVEVARSGRTINIKKGQFLAPQDLLVVAEKAKDAGCNQIMLTERGACFGYHDLVVDFRSLAILNNSEYQVVFDATHSVQQPASAGSSSGGKREYIRPLTRAALAVGVDAIFFETHPDPPGAKSDAATQLPLNEVENYLREIKQLATALAQA